MNIGNILYLDVDRSVGAKVGKIDNGGVESDVGAEFGRRDDKLFE